MKNTFSSRVPATIGLLAAGFSLAACMTTKVEEAAVAEPLAPMTEPAPYAEGTVFHGIRNGEPIKNTLISVDGDRYTWQRDTDGCTWTVDASLGRTFGPEVAWENCNSSGTAEIAGKNGQIWPLEVGKSVSYEGTGQTRGGNAWSADRRCEVVGQARITTHTGQHDTYKVVCRTEWREMVYYMSPEVGTYVKFVQRPLGPNSNSPSADWEVTRIEES